MELDQMTDEQLSAVAARLWLPFKPGDYDHKWESAGGNARCVRCSAFQQFRQDQEPELFGPRRCPNPPLFASLLSEAMDLANLVAAQTLDFSIETFKLANIWQAHASFGDNELTASACESDLHHAIARATTKAAIRIKER